MYKFGKIVLYLVMTAIVTATLYVCFLWVKFYTTSAKLIPGGQPLEYVIVTPHPPIAVPVLGRFDVLKVAKTCISMSYISTKIKAVNPDTVIIITPHSINSPNKFNVFSDSVLRGNLSRFGISKKELELNNDIQFLEKLKQISSVYRIEFNPVSSEMFLDHGSFVPALYLNKAGYKGKFIVINTSSGLSRKSHINLGKAIRQTMEEQGGKFVLIASGDMSHRLSANAPLPYNSNAHKYDDKIVQSIEKGDYEAIYKLDKQILDEASQCGYNSLLVGIGALGFKPQNNIVLSYEAPFGVGYLTGAL